MESVKRYSVGDLFASCQFGAIVVSAEDFDRVQAENLALQQRLTVQDQRGALPEDWADLLFAEMERRFELSREYHQDHMVNDDTQIGVEFAIEWITAALNRNGAQRAAEVARNGATRGTAKINRTEDK